MAEFDRLLDLLSLGNPIQDQYQALHDQEEAELEPTDVEIINLLVEFNERSLDIRSRRQLITDKYELAEEPIKESLKGLEDETRSALQEMITDLQIENEVLEIEITPLDLVEAVKKLPEAEPTTKFIIDLLTLTSVDKNENISPTSLSFDMTDKTTGGLNISSNIGGAIIEFDLGFDTDNNNEMVNIVLNTEPTENEELILKEAEFEELANIFPTVNKLVVLGFFVNVASQSK